MEVTMSSYVILEWSGAFVMVVVCGLLENIPEGSGWWYKEKRNGRK